MEREGEEGRGGKSVQWRRGGGLPWREVGFLGGGYVERSTYPRKFLYTLGFQLRRSLWGSFVSCPSYFCVFFSPGCKRKRTEAPVGSARDARRPSRQAAAASPSLSHHHPPPMSKKNGLLYYDATPLASPMAWDPHSNEPKSFPFRTTRPATAIPKGANLFLGLDLSTQVSSRELGGWMGGKGTLRTAHTWAGIEGLVRG